ncbi:hypothetical protein Dfri01_20750 [Dyadobacter frigoris]|nr:hypothetical protein Dfri01_20750 [Dyadobacter frigoris]
MVILGMLSSGVRQIDAGTIGVKSLFGEVSPQVLENGAQLCESARRGCNIRYKDPELHYVCPNQ